jgi:amino acid transporter
MICLSHLRMRYAWKIQGRDVADLPWKSWTFPYAAIWGLFWCILLIIAEFYLSLWPLGGTPSAKTFFANYVSVVAIIVIYIAAKIHYRGRLWVDARTIDLDGLRRFYVKATDEESVSDKMGPRKYASKAVGFVFN